MEYSSENEWTTIYMYQHANMDESQNHSGEQQAKKKKKKQIAGLLTEYVTRY